MPIIGSSATTSGPRASDRRSLSTTHRVNRVSAVINTTAMATPLTTRPLTRRRKGNGGARKLKVSSIPAWVSAPAVVE
jgi:hypothetical protein